MQGKVGEPETERWVADAYKNLLQRAIPHGGFSGVPSGSYRPDATAWGILALQDFEEYHVVLQKARDRLTQSQLPDGGVRLSRDHPNVFWPTSLAILAWQASLEHSECQARAVQFLLSHTGVHQEQDRSSPFGHDTSVKGWPWIAETHSWVEPTALAIIALDVAGFGTHPRVEEGIRMVMDRQLSKGGWNYGNTTVFGQELRPSPESTGMALDCVAGRRYLGAILKSLEYLEQQVSSLRTPLSLGWGIMGLEAWLKRQPKKGTMIRECLDQQARYGPYDTARLGLLLVSLRTHRGLRSIFKR